MCQTILWVLYMLAGGFKYLWTEQRRKREACVAKTQTSVLIVQICIHWKALSEENVFTDVFPCQEFSMLNRGMVSDATDIWDDICNAVCTTFKIPFIWRQQFQRIQKLDKQSQHFLHGWIPSEIRRCMFFNLKLFLFLSPNSIWKFILQCPKCDMKESKMRLLS